MMATNTSRIRRLVTLAVMINLLVAFNLADYKKVGGLNFFSPAQEVAMGQQYSRELNQKLDLVQDPFINDYISQIGRKLAAVSLRNDIEYHFFVVNSSEVNAFALPGGYIYVNRGLIEKADNESEIAGVIGHEIGHVVGRHATRQMSKKLLLAGIVLGAGAAVGAKSQKWGQIIQALGGVGVFLAAMKYSRDDERQADWLGLTEMNRAGYDPNGMVTFFQKLDQLSRNSASGGLAFLSTHPLPAERMHNMQQEMVNLPNPTDSVIHNTYSFKLCQNRLSGIPLPPNDQEKTLGAALASLDRPASSGQSSLPAVNQPAVARTLTVPGNVRWTDTGIDLVPGQIVEVTSHGRVYWKKNSQAWAPSSGAPGTGKGFWKPIPSVNTAALIGKIGDKTYKYFYIGEQLRFQVRTGGRLFLGINDDNPYDNRGAFTVTVRSGGW